jgi:hypothetical protein
MTLPAGPHGGDGASIARPSDVAPRSLVLAEVGVAGEVRPGAGAGGTLVGVEVSVRCAAARGGGPSAATRPAAT